MMNSNRLHPAKNYLDKIYSRNTVIFGEYKFEGTQYREDELYHIRPLQYDEIEVMKPVLDRMEFRAEFNLSQIKDRLHLGHFCYLVEYKENVVGYLWVARGAKYISEIDCEVQLKNNEILTYNAYVSPDHRGNNLLNKMKWTIFNNLSTEGYNTVLNYLFDWNIASKKASEKLGVAVIGHIKFGYLFGLKYMSISDSIKDRVVEHYDRFALWKRLYKRIAGRAK